MNDVPPTFLMFLIISLHESLYTKLAFIIIYLFKKTTSLLICILELIVSENTLNYLKWRDLAPLTVDIIFVINFVRVILHFFLKGKYI